MARKLSKNRVRKTRRNSKKTKRNIRKTKRISRKTKRNKKSLKRNSRKPLKKIQKGGWRESELKMVVYGYLEFLKIFGITDEDILNLITHFKFILRQSKVNNETLKLIRDSADIRVINKINLMAMYIAIRLILDKPQTDLNELEVKEALQEMFEFLTNDRRPAREDSDDDDDAYEPYMNLPPPELYDAYVAAQLIIFGMGRAHTNKLPAYPPFEFAMKDILEKIKSARKDIPDIKALKKHYPKLSADFRKRVEYDKANPTPWDKEAAMKYHIKKRHIAEAAAAAAARPLKRVHASAAEDVAAAGGETAADVEGGETANNSELICTESDVSC
jgi:hypothetical protein